MNSEYKAKRLYATCTKLFHKSPYSSRNSVAGIRCTGVKVAHSCIMERIGSNPNHRPKRKFIKNMSFEKAVSNLEGSEKSSLLVMERDLNPTTAPIGESPMVQFLISGCSTDGSARGLGPRCRRFKSCHSDQLVPGTREVKVGSSPTTERFDSLKSGFCKTSHYPRSFGVARPRKGWCVSSILTTRSGSLA